MRSKSIFSNCASKAWPSASAVRPVPSEIKKAVLFMAVSGLVLAECRELFGGSLGNFRSLQYHTRQIRDSALHRLKGDVLWKITSSGLTTWECLMLTVLEARTLPSVK